MINVKQAALLITMGGMWLLLACSGHNDSRGSADSDSSMLEQSPYVQPLIVFDTLDHDFGTIVEGEMVVCYFQYINGGETDLIIKSVEASCGCTTPDWSRAPLRPGEKAYLKIIFDATGRSGAQRKIITINSNASNSVVYLTLKANIDNSV